MRRLTPLLVLLLSIGTPALCPAQAPTLDSLRVELVRSRGFLRGAETQLSKTLAILDSLVASAPDSTAPVDSTPTPPPPPVSTLASVAVVPAAYTLAVGQQKLLIALPQDAAGKTLALTGRTVSWQSSDPTVATVHQGLVTSVAPGSATITATIDGTAGTMALTVAADSSAPPVLGVPVDSTPIAPTPTDSLLTTAPAVTDSAGIVVIADPRVARIVGPQLALGSARNPWPWFDQNEAAHATELWGSDGTGLTERSHGYYYDTALTQYILYYRSGDTVALHRARAAADYWWTTKLIGSGATAPAKSYAPREVALGGLILRAMDGRPELWPWITAYARWSHKTWLGSHLDLDHLWYGVRDGGYTLLYDAWLGAVHPDSAVRAEFRADALAAVTKYYARLQRADGGWYWHGTDNVAPDREFAEPFMPGLLLEGLIATHQVTGDTTVARSILRAVDWEWKVYDDTTVIPGQAPLRWRAAPYFAFPDGTGKPFPQDSASVLPASPRNNRQRNSLVVHAFGYAYQLTGDEKYLREGDEIFASTYGHGQGPGADRYYGLADYRGKEYNQAYRNTGRYLVWRLGR